MKRFRYRGIGRMVVILSLGLTLAITGCKSNEDTTEPTENEAVTVKKNKNDVVDGKIVNSAVMLTVNDTDVTYSEAMVYINMIREKYEPVLSKHIWEFEVDKDKSFEDMAKEEIINQIIRLKVMRDVAEDKGIELSADEKLEIEDMSSKFLAGISMEDQDKYGIKLNTVKTIYEDNQIAQKLFDSVTGDVDTEIADEDCRCVAIKQYVALFSGKDKDGQSYSGTPSAIDAAKEKADNAYKAIVTEGNDFVSYSTSNSDVELVSTTVSKGELSKSLEEAVFSLKDGEVSKVIKGENGYYIFLCTCVNDEKAQANKKEEIIKQRQDELFTETYNGWLADSKVLLVTDLWNMIKF